MSQSSPCPVCGDVVPEGAPESMCPRCLLALAGPALRDEPTQASVKLSSLRATETQTFTVGTRVGDYELLREIGRGGMGVVYEARHSGLKRKVALKILPWSEFASEEQRERFRREAEAAARLNHANIVSVYEWGNHGGCPFMAMQLVENPRTLADEIGKGPMPPREAARIIAKVARGVHYSHQHGVLHRDIKPGNILIDANREPLLVDFGVARMEDAAFRLTHTDLVCGTPSYMPPEQAAGGDFTTASDVYSLGAVLYEALTGVPPFRGKTVADIMRQLAEKEPASPRSLRPELDRDLSTVVLKCLEKNPARRYGSAEAFAEDLERWQAHWPIRARPGTMTTRVVKWARRRPAVAGLTTALVLTILVGLTLLVRGYQESRDQLCKMFLAEARARRLSQKPGQRFDAIESLKQAAAIRPSMELQDEAVAALAVADLRLAEMWEGNPDKERLVALSKDFQFTAYPRADGTVVVCRREGLTLVTLATLPGEGIPVNWILRFSPDSQWLAVGHCANEDDEVRVVVWDWRNARPVVRQQNVTRASLDFWPDGKRMVTCVGDELHFHRLPGGEKDGPSRKLPGSARSVRVSTKGNYIAASLIVPSIEAGTVAVLETNDASAGPIWLLPNDCAVQMLAWHPVKDWIAAPCEDGKIRIWDAKDGKLRQTLIGHTAPAEEAVWNPEGNLMASNSADGTLRLWDAATGQPYMHMDQPTREIMFSADGMRLGPGLDGVNVRVFEVAPLRGCRRLHGPTDGMVSSGAWNADRSLLATGDKQVRLWNIAGYELGRLPFDKPRSVVFRQDSLIATGGGGVVRWPLRIDDTEGIHHVIVGEPAALSSHVAWGCAAMSKDEQFLVVARPSEVALFDLGAPAKPPRILLPGHPGAHYVSFSPDGKCFATGTQKGNDVWVWDAASGAVIRKLTVRGGACVAFTANGSKLVTGNENEYRCWDTKTWKADEGHPRIDSIPGTIVVSPRKTALAISHTRQKVRLVRPDNFLTLGEPDCGPNYPLCFSQDGSIFVSTNMDGHVFVWDMAWIRHEVEHLELDWKLEPLESKPAALIERAVMPEG
jgi:WD40 repeat protein